MARGKLINIQLFVTHFFLSKGRIIIKSIHKQSVAIKPLRQLRIKKTKNWPPLPSNVRVSFPVSNKVTALLHTNTIHMDFALFAGVIGLS
jgi:hypothetical protein